MKTIVFIYTLMLLTTQVHGQFLRGFVKIENPSGIIFTSDRPEDAMLEDFDGDGDLDLAILLSFPNNVPDNPNNSTRHKIQLYANNGSGAFTPSHAIYLRNSDLIIKDFTCGDLNNDGLLDFATTERRGPSSGDPGGFSLVVSLNTGNMTFTNPLYFDTYAGTHGVAITDINSDGNADILVCDSYTDTVRVYHGNGTGLSFVLADAVETGITKITGDGPSKVVAADLNHDGLVDIATLNWNSQDVSVLYQRPNGLFWDGVLAVTFPVDTNPREIHIHDINYDGDLDIVVASEGHEIEYFYNDYGSGSEPRPNFNDYTNTIPGTFGATNLLFDHIDCTNDWIFDLATNSSYMSVFLGLGGRNFTTALYNDPEWGGSRAKILGGDIDNDGDTDIFRIATNSYSLDFNLYRNRCTEQPCPADFNNDRFMSFFDVSLFLEAYTSGDPSADFNSDGVINFFDVSSFLAAYQAGCPD